MCPSPEHSASSSNSVSIPAEILDHARRLQARTRRLIDGSFSGQYLSVFKGSGVEFAEVREYVDGDDIRTIDWNVTARSDRAFVKRYVEERNLTVVLVVDVSGSTAFGSTGDSKRERAAQIAMAIAIMALRNGDRVGLVLFTDRVERCLAPQCGRNRALEIATTLLTFEPAGQGTSISTALAFARRICRQRSLVFLLSDFIDDSDYSDALRGVAARHDLIPICLQDRNEQQLPPVGLLAVRDLETGVQNIVDTSSARVREAFVAARSEDTMMLVRRLRRLGLEHVQVDAEEPWVVALQRFFHARRRRAQSGR